MKRLSLTTTAVAAMTALAFSTTPAVTATIQEPITIENKISSDSLVATAKSADPDGFEQIMQVLWESDALVSFAAQNGDIEHQLEPIAATTSLQDAQNFVAAMDGKHFVTTASGEITIQDGPAPLATASAQRCGRGEAAYIAYGVGTGLLCTGVGVATLIGGGACGLAAHQAANYIDFSRGC